MNSFRKLAHLWEQLGEERFNALISSDNTGKVKAFCDSLFKDAMTTSITIGDRTYEILGFLQGNETSVVGQTMVKRGKDMNANLGENEGKYLLDNQRDIPTDLRGKVVFVFTDWRHPYDSECVYCVYWDDDRWFQGRIWLFNYWDDSVRVLRRK